MFRGGFARLSSVAAAGMALAASAAWAVAGDRPNIVWVIGDDWGADAAVYGTPAVETPNVDRLASEGVRFSHAFVTAPVCSAMRSSLITGMYQTSIGAAPPPDQDQAAAAGGCVAHHDLLPQRGLLHQQRQPQPELKRQDRLQLPGQLQEHVRRERLARPARGCTVLPRRSRSSARTAGSAGANSDPERTAALALPPYYPDHPLARKDYADYLADVENFDSGVGAVLDRLESDGLADNTIVMVFGDHGAPHVRGQAVALRRRHPRPRDHP